MLILYSECKCILLQRSFTQTCMRLRRLNSVLEAAEFEFQAKYKLIKRLVQVQCSIDSNTAGVRPTGASIKELSSFVGSLLVQDGVHLPNLGLRWKCR